MRLDKSHRLDRQLRMRPIKPNDGFAIAFYVQVDGLAGRLRINGHIERVDRLASIASRLKAKLSVTSVGNVACTQLYFVATGSSKISI